MNKGLRGLARLIAAAKHSWDGFCTVYRDEPAFRQEVWAAAVLLPMAFILPVSGGERALLIVVTLLPLVAELINSSVEAVIDLVMPTEHPLAKKAKDSASAAVLLALGLGALVWGATLVRFVWLT